VAFQLAAYLCLHIRHLWNTGCSVLSRCSSVCRVCIYVLIIYQNFWRSIWLHFDEPYQFSAYLTIVDSCRSFCNLTTYQVCPITALICIAAFNCNRTLVIDYHIFMNLVQCNSVTSNVGFPCRKQNETPLSAGDILCQVLWCFISIWISTFFRISPRVSRSRVD